MAVISVFLIWNLVAGPLLYLATPPMRDTVIMIDVGKGNCVVVTSKDGTVIVYDTGSTTFRSVGERKLAPFLWDQRIRRIDAIILSDSQADHANGVREIVRRFRVEKVIVSNYFSSFESGATLKRLLESDGVNVEVVSAGQTIQCGTVRCDVLWPPKDAKSLTPNDSSLVVKLTDSDKRILLTGDVEDAAAEELLRNPESLECEILQVPHHGRAMDLEEEFAAAARPDVALISDVEGRLSGRSVEFYNRRGSDAYGTWDSGSVTIDLETMKVSEFNRVNQLR
jgi:competence protein ComEC